jgi:hypothetical protein
MVSETNKGLTANEAKDKLRTEGHNSLPSSKPKNFFFDKCEARKCFYLRQ